MTRSRYFGSTAQHNPERGWKGLRDFNLFMDYVEQNQLDKFRNETRRRSPFEQNEQRRVLYERKAYSNEETVKKKKPAIKKLAHIYIE